MTNIIFLWYHLFNLVYFSQSARIGNAVFERSSDLIPHTPVLICSAHLHVQLALRGYCPVTGGGTTSQLDLPSVTPLSIAGCGRLQLGAANWATSVVLLQVVVN